MSELSDLLLAFVLHYGAPALGMAMLFGGAGLPVPTTLLVIAAGAFVRQGLVDLPHAAGLALLGVVLGDSLCYAIGRYAGQWAERRYGNTNLWVSAQIRFQKYGGLSIFLTRFLIPTLAIPVNLLAGSTAYGYRRFLPWVFAGEIAWMVLYGGLGYAFGSQWAIFGRLVYNFSGLLVCLVVLGVGVYLIVHRLRRDRAPQV